MVDYLISHVDPGGQLATQVTLAIFAATEGAAPGGVSLWDFESTPFPGRAVLWSPKSPLFSALGKTKPIPESSRELWPQKSAWPGWLNISGVAPFCVSTGVMWPGQRWVSPVLVQGPPHGDPRPGASGTVPSGQEAVRQMGLLVHSGFGKSGSM